MSPVGLALYAASFVVAAGMAVFFITQGVLRAGPLAYVFPVFLAGILAVNAATALSRAQAHADGSLQVRNRFRTRTLQRREIDRVFVGGRPGLASPLRVELLLTDGQLLPLVGTETPPLPGVRRRLEGQADQLRAWVAGTAVPYR